MKQIRNIGILHYQVGNTDGVSLEISKWKQVLEKMGRSVHLCAGDLGTDEGFKIPELYHHSEEIREIDRNAFIELIDYDPATLLNGIETISHRIEEGLQAFIKSNQIDLLIVNNVWSVALNLPAAMALERVRQKLSIKTLAHHHDFYWERRGGIHPTCQPIQHILGQYFPPIDSSINHVVINSQAQKTLAQKRGIQAGIVPNVFDFDTPAWSVNSYNQDLRERIGLRESDIMILQATRVIPRKAIELAIDFVKTLNTPERRLQLSRMGLYNGQKFTEDSRIVLVMTGYSRDDVSGNYLQLLMDKAHAETVDVLHIEEVINHARDIRNGEKTYSFWDAYAVADLITYPSVWEGWGNQLLEAFKARLPVILFEYPVYTADIKAKGFDVISLGSEIDGYNSAGLASVKQTVLDRASDEAITVLTDPDQRQRMVIHNHQVCQKHYSLSALQAMLTDILEVI